VPNKILSHPQDLINEVCRFSPYICAKWMALLPLVKSTTYETTYFGGIGITSCGPGWHQMLLLDPALLLLSQLAEYLPGVLAQLHVKRLPAALWNENDVVFTVPLGVI
jgi:hypothetical protein